jgi:opacity protein-like surface antigen
MRGDIFIVARASADLQGVFGIEVNSTRFGEGDTAFNSYTGTAGVGSGLAGRWNADAIAIQVKSMYIDFKVPALPVRLKVGIQPFQLRNPVFLYADAAGVTGNIKIPAGDYVFNINPFWAVQSHGTVKNITMPFIVGNAITNVTPTDWTTADDGNFFGVDLNAVIGDIKPGVFFAMQRLSQVYNNTLFVSPSPPAPAAVYYSGEGNQNLWWLGAYVDGKVGPVDFTGDFIYNGGYDEWESGAIYLSDPSSATPTGFGTYSKRHEAWITRLVAGYNLNKLRVGMGFLYGTGDNFATADKQEGFVLPYRSEAAKFNDDFVVLTGDWGLRQPYGTQNVGGLFKAWSSVGQGVWYIRAFADYAVTDWLKLKVNAGYIEDTVKSGDEFGGDANNDQQIGWELDAGVQINIYKNLYLDTTFGYLIGGKALLGQTGGLRAQDPWAWATVLSYVF